MKIFFLIIVLAGSVFAQHQIPFASSNNTIELSIRNTAVVNVENVSVEVSNAPSWLKFQNQKSEIRTLNANETSTARFTFFVDRSAPVNKPEQVIFKITNPNGETWTKTLSLQVSPPERFELFQNYPNPFNPTTTISYLLPGNSEVTIKIFDVTGREVAALFSGFEEPGYHQHEWRASSVSSGMYIYQAAMKNEKGSTEYYRKKMLMMK